jgi:hypothetical protein
MAGASAERQESGLVRKINSAVTKNKKNPITLIAGKTKITSVIRAAKFTGRQLGGSEPYTDVQIFRRVRGKEVPINLSMKGESAPSLAGGGLKGIELAVPGLGSKFFKKAHTSLVEDFNSGDKIPDVFGKISKQHKKKIVVGNKDMGGPIDYMYIGPMTVTSTYEVKKNILKVNGKLHEAVEYADSHDLYFRFRARREDQRFDPDAVDNHGVPKIYGKSPSRGDSAGRLVVTDKVPSTGRVIRL